MNGASQQQKREEVLELAAIDALGLLTERECHRLERLVEHADPELQEQIRRVRHEVIQQMKEDLPDVDPDPSLKHRVIGSVLQYIERDYERTLQRPNMLPAFSDHEKPHDWVERLASGRVSPVWRVAALIMITISVGLFWMLVELMQANREIRQLARGNESRELFERQIGPEALDFIFVGERVSFFPASEDSPSRAMVSYLPEHRKGLFLADRLPAIGDDEVYEVHVSTLDVDEVVIRFTSKGQFISLDFDLPDSIPNPADAHWLVNRVNVDGASELIMETVS